MSDSLSVGALMQKTMLLCIENYKQTNNPEALKAAAVFAYHAERYGY